MTSFAKMATVTASTERAGTVVAGIEAAAVEIIASLACLPLDPVNPEVAQGFEGLGFRELLQTAVEGGLDIQEGDILVVSGTRYPIRSVADWFWGPDGADYVVLYLEDKK